MDSIKMDSIVYISNYGMLFLYALSGHSANVINMQPNCSTGHLIALALKTFHLNHFLLMFNWTLSTQMSIAN